MAQIPSADIISVLADNQASTEQKLRAAKELKNTVVGQDQRKELAVKNGIVQPLADILSSATKATGKRRQESNGVSLRQSQEWTPEDELTLQATLIIGSLASAGQALLHPLCAAGIPKLLVQALSTDTSLRLATAILQASKTLATFWAAADELPTDYEFWSAIFNVGSLEVLDCLLRRPASSPAARQQLRLVAEIVSVVPNSAASIKGLITNCGLLDTLSSLLVSHTIENKIVWYNGAVSQLPPPPPIAIIPSIMAAIATTISGSNYRSHRFILAPHLRDLFLQTGTDASDQRSQFGPRFGFANPHEPLLPPLYIRIYKTVSHNPSSHSFPALKTLQTGKTGNDATDNVQLAGDIDHSNAVIGWLLVLTRSMRDLNRLKALRLLALVANAMEADPMGQSHKTEFSQKLRERQKQLAMIAVPLAVQLVQVANEGKCFSGMEERKDSQEIKGQACSVLALLIDGSKELQMAAVEAGAIKHVCPILKKSFDSVPMAKSMWSSKSGSNDNTMAQETCTLGRSTLPVEILHAMRCRQGALKALQALAAKEDVHRKAIVDSGVVSCIIDSLRPIPPDTVADATSDRTSISSKDGNTMPVILAACGAAQSMSRSVSVLRTSLIDGGIAQPLAQLLHSANLDIQIAATDVCCNLLPDFSPMREDLTKNNVVKTLVEHARSSSPALRLSSLWAIKHLVYACPKDVKLSTLEELGTGWLVGIIQGEQHEAAASGGGVSIGLSTPNAAGEQVDLLNPSTMDVDEPGHTGLEMMDEDEDDDDGEVLYDEASSTHYQASGLRSTLAPTIPAFNSTRYLSSIREMEQNDEYTSKREEIAIQQQALDLIRNLINGDDSAALADHILNEIGSSKVYELLTTKLSPLSPSLTAGRKVYNTTELVLSTIHVIIHLANASSTHRQTLITQKPLLQAMLPHFNHVDHRVRAMSVWAINSLTWIEEDGDRRDARKRSNELKALGIEQAVKALQNDPNLDVRERVKTAMRQFEVL